VDHTLNVGLINSNLFLECRTHPLTQVVLTSSSWFLPAA